MASKKPAIRSKRQTKSVAVLENSQGPALPAQPAGFSNGLQEAIFGLGQGVAPGQGAQLSQTATLQHNLRVYLISNNRQLLSQAYVEIGLLQNVVNVPVDDAMRGGIVIKTKQITPQQVDKLIARIERRSLMSSVVGQAAKWNRLYGGSAILVLTDQDPRTPLNVQAIKKGTRLEYRAVDMWELFYNLQNIEGVDPAEGQGFYREQEYYNYYGVQIHKSRVMIMKGLVAPSFIRPRLRGWGFSIAEPLIRSINNFLKSTDLAFEVLDEFKLDVYKIKNLAMTLMSADGTEKVRQRVQLANIQKNYQNAVTMDADDDYEQKQISWAGIPDMMKEFRIGVAADMRMPITKLFGISSAGFNSGEDDIENYNAMVEGEIREKIKFDVLTLVELEAQHEFGFVPDDLQIEFKPLRILSSEQEENVKTEKFNRLLQARQAGEILTEEFRAACNQDRLLSIQLEVHSLELEAEQEETAEAEGNGETDDGESPKSDEKPASGSASDTERGKKRLAKEAKSPKDPKDSEG